MQSCVGKSLWGPFQGKAKAAMAMIQSSTKGVLVVVSAFLVLALLFSTPWINGTSLAAIINSRTFQALTQSSHHPRSRKPPPKPITLQCPPENQTTIIPICRAVDLSPAPSPSQLPHDGAAPHRRRPSSSSSSSCPAYFRWIHEDLRPWSSTGISLEAVERARRFANFRLVILGGRVYMEQYHKAFQTRDVFTLWGILQLLRRYPGRVPDLDLMFNCDDRPIVRAADHPAPASAPPLFRYCKDDATLDIVFPDWSFWGWPEVNIKPWEPLLEELKEGNERVRWKKREPYAFWKGNPWVSGTRQDLMKCNVSNGREWNARLYSQDWISEMKQGFKGSNLANQCHHRYKIYIEGQAWSVSQKYILECDSPTLRVRTRFQDFFSRGLMPGRHYWPIRDNDKCRSIKFAVDWGNAHQKEAQKMGKEASGFIENELNMDYVYDYMFHLLSNYAKLLKYKPSKPERAAELCLESMACPATGREKAFLMESAVREPHDSDPCRLPPPFDPVELKELLKRKDDAVREVETKEQRAWDRQKNKH